MGVARHLSATLRKQKYTLVGSKNQLSYYYSNRNVSVLEQKDVQGKQINFSDIQVWVSRRL